MRLRYGPFHENLQSEEMELDRYSEKESMKKRGCPRSLEEEVLAEEGEMVGDGKVVEERKWSRAGVCVI